MIFNNVKLLNFRNHLDSEYEFEPGINVIWGNNGVGKTSILEAMSVCSMSKSFVTTDVSLINRAAKQCSVTGFCTNDFDIPYKINIAFALRQPKKITSSIGQNLLPKHIIGEIPIVILSPDNKRITAGSPDYRRQFINGILSQSNKIYLEQLYDLRKIIKQRNALIAHIKNDITHTNDQSFQLLHQWTQLFINVSADIIIKRNDFISKFNNIFIEAYNTLSNDNEQVQLFYVADSIHEPITDKEQVISILKERYNSIKTTEIRRISTLFGPQKDDIKITINGGIAKEFASQGQHKSLLIALKFAEFQYLLENKNETPVILFDDIFSELDDLRISKVLGMLSVSEAQIFITTTSADTIKNILPTPSQFIQIKN